MNVDFFAVLSSLERNHIRFELVELGNGAKIIVTQYGGRVLGPFAEDGTSLCWINPCIGEQDQFLEFLRQRQWDLGGDRLWLAPEIQYNIPDPADFFGSELVSGELDPGNYEISRIPGGNIEMQQEMTLPVYGQSVRQKTLYIKRTIRLASSPFLHAEGPKVACFGYEQEFFLEEASNDGIKSEVWNILQGKPGGYVYIPTTAQVKYTDYYQSLQPGYQEIHPTYVKLKVDAESHFKIGYKALYTTGRSAYLGRCEQSDFLMVRSFFNDPAGQYVKSPPWDAGETGHALHIYNDDGRNGRFFEHESSGLPIGGDTGRGMSLDRISTWYFMGNTKELHKTAKLLLGIKLTF